MAFEKLPSLLGLCRRAHTASFGHDTALNALKTGKAHLCLLAADASARLEAEFTRENAFLTNPIPVIRIPLTIDEIGHATRLKSAVLTINEAGFAKSIQQSLHNTGEELPHDQ